MNKEKKKTCRHDRNMWVMCGGWMWWCYVCGAIREARAIKPNSTVPRGKWIKPTGDKNNNPADKLLKK